MLTRYSSQRCGDGLTDAASVLLHANKAADCSESVEFAVIYVVALALVGRHYDAR